MNTLLRVILMVAFVWFVVSAALTGMVVNNQFGKLEPVPALQDALVIGGLLAFTIQIGAALACLVAGHLLGKLMNARRRREDGAR